LFSPPGPSSSFQFDPNTSSSDKEQKITADILLEEETTFGSSSKYALPSSAHPIRQIKPTRRLFESIEGRLSTTKTTPRRHQVNFVSLSLEPPKTMQEALSR